MIRWKMTVALIFTVLITVIVYAVFKIVKLETEMSAGMSGQLKAYQDSMTRQTEPFHNAMQNLPRLDKGQQFQLETDIKFLDSIQVLAKQSPFDTTSVQRPGDSRYRLTVIHSFGWPYVINIYSDSVSLVYINFDTSEMKYQADPRYFSKSIDFRFKRELDNKFLSMNFWLSPDRQIDWRTIDGYIVQVEGVSRYGYNKVYYRNPPEASTLELLIRDVFEKVEFEAEK